MRPRSARTPKAPASLEEAETEGEKGEDAQVWRVQGGKSLVQREQRPASREEAQQKVKGKDAQDW